MIEVRITWMGTKEGWLEIIQYKISGDRDFNLLKQWGLCYAEGIGCQELTSAFWTLPLQTSHRVDSGTILQGGIFNNWSDIILIFLQSCEEEFWLKNLNIWERGILNNRPYIILGECPAFPVPCPVFRSHYIIVIVDSFHMIILTVFSYWSYWSYWLYSTRVNFRSSLFRSCAPTIVRDGGDQMCEVIWGPGAGLVGGVGVNEGEKPWLMFQQWLWCECFWPRWWWTYEEVQGLPKWKGWQWSQPKV